METLVAFAILSVSLMVIYDIWRTSLIRSEANQRRAVAVELTRSLMEERLAFPSLALQEETGTFDTIYSWRVVTEAFPPPVPSGTFGWDPVKITAEVTWPGPPEPQTITFESIKLSERP